MKDRTLHRAFPIVAAAIGQRFGIKVRVGGDQAYTNGGVIQLPAYDGDDPDYKNYAWGLLAHEAFHIRYSDFTIDYGRQVLRRRLCGAIEDVRIEYEGAKVFPGARLTIRKVIEKMIAQGKFRQQNKHDHPGDILHGYVLKSLRANVLVQTALNPLLAETEKALQARFPNGAIIRLKGLLSEVPEGLTCERDCLSLADRILDMIEEEVQKESDTPKEKPEAAPSNQAASGSQDESGQDDPSQASAQDNSGEFSEDEGQAGAASNGTEDEGETETQVGQGAESPDPDPDGSDSDDSDLESPSSGGAGDVENDDPTDDDANGGQVGGENLETLLQQILDTREDDLEADVFNEVKAMLKIDDSRVASISLPSGEEPECDDIRGMALYRKVQGESGQIRAALDGMVQSHRRNRPVHKRSGNRIDARQLPKLPTGDTRVFVRQAHKPNPNTAVHLLVDRSDSMGYQAHDTEGRFIGTRMPLALEATMALAMAFEGIPGVNAGITAFPGSDDRSVYTMLRHGQKLKSRVGAFALTPDGGTPMAEGIWYAAASLLMCREPRKVLMVLTDGDPNDALTTLDILDRCRRSGIEAAGVGLGIEVDHLFPKAIVINDLRELRTQLFELARELLIAA